jgi:hypothetical protein
LTPSFIIIRNHNQLQELTINLQPRTRSIFILVLIQPLIILFIILFIVLCSIPILLVLLPAKCLSHIVEAETTQHRKHRFPYCCRGMLPFICLANSLGADHVENISSVVRTPVYWPVAQHRAWLGPHRKHFSCIVCRVCCGSCLAMSLCVTIYINWVVYVMGTPINF